MASTRTFDDTTSRIQAEDEVIRRKLKALREAHHKMESVKQREKIKIDNLKEDQSDAQRSFNEKKLVIDVSGATSAGKSTVINALVRRDLLFTAAEHCTPCSVSIETSPDINEPFVTTGKPSECSEKLPIDRLKALSDAKSDQQSKEPLYVCLPQDIHDEGVFRVPNLRLVDTPGLYEDVDEESVDIEGDAFVFVVDFDTGVKWDELEKKLRQKKGRSHSWKAVFFAYNRCDIVEKFNKERFEKGKREKLAKAVTFLKDNGVYSDDSSAKAKVFFLSAYAAWMARRYKASAQVLLKRIANCHNQANTTVLLVRGVSEAGKTTLCDDLCGIRSQSADDPLVEKRSMTELGVDQTGGASTDAQQKSIAVVDSPSEDEVREWIASDALQCTVLAVVIDGTKSLKKIQPKIQKQLTLCSGNTMEVFLIITKLNEMKEAKGAREAAMHEKEIREHWKALGRSESNLFFMEKDEVMEEYETAFSHFETQVVEAAQEKFADIKLKRIEDMAEKLKKGTLKKINGKLAKLEKMQCEIRNVSDNLSAKHEDVEQRRSTRAIQFLDKTQVDTLKVSESQSKVEDTLTKFAEFCRKEADEDFQKVINKATEHLRKIDSKLEERIRSQHLLELQRHFQPEGSSFDREDQMQRLQSLIPDMRIIEEGKSVEELKKEKKMLKKEISELSEQKTNQKSKLDANKGKLKRKKEQFKQVDDVFKSEKRKQTELKTKMERKERGLKDCTDELQQARQAKKRLDQDASQFDNKLGGLAIVQGAVSAIPNIPFPTASSEHTSTDGKPSGLDSSTVAIANTAVGATKGAVTGLAQVFERKSAREDFRRNQAYENEKSMKEEKTNAVNEYYAAVDIYEASKISFEEVTNERQAKKDDLEKYESDLTTKEEIFSKLSIALEQKTKDKKQVIEDLEQKKRRIHEGKEEYDKKKADFRQTFPKRLQEESEKMTETILRELITVSKRITDAECSPLREEEREFKEILAEIKKNY